MEKHYLAKEGREITIEEIAKELKVTKEDIALAMESVAPVESIEKTKQKQKTKNLIKNKRKHRLITVIRIKPKLLTKQAMPERKASLKEQR